MTDLDDMLREYLERERLDPIRRRLEAASNWQIEHDQKDNERHGTLLRALDGHAFRLSAVEGAAERARKLAEESGSHHVQALEEKSKKVDTLLWGVIKTVLFVLCGGGVVELIHRVSGH